MAGSLGIAKLCVCAGAGALIGGAAVHTIEKPKPRPRVARIVPKKAAAPPALKVALAAPAPLPCEPMMTPELAVRVPAALYGLPQQDGPVAQSMMFPISAAARPVEDGQFTIDDGPRLAEPSDVPEPGMLGLLGLAVIGLAAARRRHG